MTAISTDIQIRKVNSATDLLRAALERFGYRQPTLYFHRN